MRNQSFLLIGFLACALASCEGDDDDGNETGGSGGRTGGTVGVTGGVGGGTAGKSSGGRTSGGAGGTAGEGIAGEGVAGEDTSGEGGSGGAAAQLDDAEILKVLDTANTGEIEQATLALTRAQSNGVREYAELMIEVHTEGKEKGQMVAEAETITPEPNPVSEALESASAAIVVRLQAAEDTAFDVTYMESQVAVHTDVLNLLDDRLIPSAGNASVLALLQGARQHVVHHLELAKTLLGSLQ